MSRYKGRDKSIHQRGKVKTAVVLANLGTPAEPTEAALRTYLRQFLSDPRVVEIPRIVWMIILHGIILRVRPKKSAALYKSIWTEQGSPLMVISEAIKEKVASQIAVAGHDDVTVELAMRYGEPAIPRVLDDLQKRGVENIVIMPLYPQYAGPTTASVFDEVMNEIKTWRWIPSLHFVSGYHQDEAYIEALAASIQEDFDKHGKPQKLVLSYHGMPKLFLDNGDPYYCFCHQTTKLVAAKLGLSDEDFIMTFQSRFGKAEWLKPYTDATLEELPAQGITDVAIVSPAFSADCLETLEELEEENREVFEEAGGKQYRYIKALNDRDDHCAAITGIVSKYLK